MGSSSCEDASDSPSNNFHFRPPIRKQYQRTKGPSCAVCSKLNACAPANDLLPPTGQPMYRSANTLNRRWTASWPERACRSTQPSRSHTLTPFGARASGLAFSRTFFFASLDRPLTPPLVHSPEQAAGQEAAKISSGPQQRLLRSPLQVGAARGGVNWKSSDGDDGD